MIPFYFEGNQAWGLIDSHNRLMALIKSHMHSHYTTAHEAISFIKRAKHRPGSRHNTEHAFGFYPEYNGDLTLGEWMKQVGNAWPCEKELRVLDEIR